MSRVTRSSTRPLVGMGSQESNAEGRYASRKIVETASKKATLKPDKTASNTGTMASSSAETEDVHATTRKVAETLGSMQESRKRKSPEETQVMVDNSHLAKKWRVECDGSQQERASSASGIASIGTGTINGSYLQPAAVVAAPSASSQNAAVAIMSKKDSPSSPSPAKRLRGRQMGAEGPSVTHASDAITRLDMALRDINQGSGLNSPPVVPHSAESKAHPEELENMASAKKRRYIPGSSGFDASAPRFSVMSLGPGTSTNLTVTTCGSNMSASHASLSAAFAGSSGLSLASLSPSSANTAAVAAIMASSPFSSFPSTSLPNPSSSVSSMSMLSSKLYSSAAHLPPPSATTTTILPSSSSSGNMSNGQMSFAPAAITGRFKINDRSSLGPGGEKRRRTRQNLSREVVQILEEQYKICNYVAQESCKQLLVQKTGWTFLLSFFISTILFSILRMSMSFCVNVLPSKKYTCRTASSKDRKMVRQ